ncbi:hypothetical protein J6590_024447 [Homalodisca vitripennis]|nr:hypothetical protein J6590_024447 [Homalodisca vitripennis]
MHKHKHRIFEFKIKCGIHYHHIFFQKFFCQTVINTHTTKTCLILGTVVSIHDSQQASATRFYQQLQQRTKDFTCHYDVGLVTVLPDHSLEFLTFLMLEEFNIYF